MWIFKNVETIYKLLTKKIEILEAEATLRLNIKRQNDYDEIETKTGKKGR